LLHGPRDNGKSTLLALFLTLLGPYAILLQIESLMARQQESSNAQADLADLKGARFVMTSETEDGQRLAEGKLKRITQGTGRIKAVRKYENPIVFDETHKLWVDCNFPPVLRGHDEAIWRRLRTIPFTVIIPLEEQDKRLPAKLLTEAEGILSWAVAGAVEWNQHAYPLFRKFIS
jgi:putative DNA primase/helicase